MMRDCWLYVCFCRKPGPIRNKEKAKRPPKFWAFPPMGLHIKAEGQGGLPKHVKLGV